MAAKRLEMQNIKRLLELRFHNKLSHRQVAKSLGCGRTTIQRYEKLAIEKELTDFTLVRSLSDEELLNQLGLEQDISLALLRKKEVLPDWKEIHLELMTRKHLTLALLWEEYIDKNPLGYKYSQFCEHYRRWKKTLSVTMRQEYKAGEKLFVDYAGSTIPIVINPKTKEIREACVFVGVLGASSYTYCEATWSQGSKDWLMSHRRMFEYFGGVPHILIPDNLKSGVKQPCRYEAKLNRSYEELCRHYGTCAIPARVQSPRDKAKAETGVLLISRWIIAALRNKVFNSLDELNEEISHLLEKLNNKPMKLLKKSRKELFESIDRSALFPLNSTPYVFSEWKKARVNIDYHVAFDGSFYSVPYQLVQKPVDIRATDSTIEIFRQHNRIASHRRSYRKGDFTTDFSHRPQSHQEHLKWTPERIVQWAKQKGHDTSLFVKKLIESKPHPEQGYRAAVGIIRLSDKYGQDRLNRACAKALQVQSTSYRIVKNMLDNNMDKVEPVKVAESQKEFFTSNTNVRGSEYYQ